MWDALPLEVSAGLSGIQPLIQGALHNSSLTMSLFTIIDLYFQLDVADSETI